MKLEEEKENEKNIEKDLKMIYFNCIDSDGLQHLSKDQINIVAYFNCIYSEGLQQLSKDQINIVVTSIDLFRRFPPSQHTPD